MSLLSPGGSFVADFILLFSPLFSIVFRKIPVFSKKLTITARFCRIVRHYFPWKRLPATAGKEKRSGYLSTHVAMMDTLKCSHLTGKAILCHTIGGLCAGVAANWGYQILMLLL
jgi:hypothetical protein